MYYTIGEAAKRMNVSTSTIRFYDKNGLLPFVERDENGRRQFKDNDFNFLQVISCLKKSGVPVKTIRDFIQLSLQGDTTLTQRYDYLDYEEKQLEAKIAELNEQLDYLRYKKWYYKTAIEAETEDIHFIEGTKFVHPEEHQKYLTILEQSDDIDALINF